MSAMRGKTSARRQPVSVRAPLRSYISVGFVTLFFSGLIYYLGFPVAAPVLAGVSVLVLAYFASLDRIVFNGRRIERLGPGAAISRALRWDPMRIRLRAIDQVDTEARRSIKRGGRVRYTYLTTVRGRDTKLTFASNAAGYPEIVRELLPRLPDDVLDSRSIDLRDHLVQPGEADRRAAEANIPPADVLEGSLIAKDLTAARPAAEPVDRERAQELRAIGNELKVAGSLARAVEAFRRALRFGSDDAWLLFDFARCIKSLAAAEDSPDLDRKSIALMRLAERRAGSDSELLSRLGEVYFQAGEWRRAAVVFSRAVEPKRANFRAFRGMAEVALRDGKIAHVIHNFAAAHRLAANPALRRWSRDEMDYFSRLNDDEDFLEMEISRITLLDKLATARRVTLRAALFGFPPIAAGFAVGSEVLTQIGWTISTLGVLLWMFATGLRRLMAERMPIERA